MLRHMLAIDYELLGYLRIGALVWHQMNPFLQEACLFLCEILQDWSWFLWLYEIVLLMAFSLVFPHIWVWMMLSLLKIIDLLACECSHLSNNFVLICKNQKLLLDEIKWDLSPESCILISPLKKLPPHEFLPQSTWKM